MKEISVSEPWFSYLKNKKKKIEGRLNKGTFAQLQKGEIIKFVNNNDSFKAKIKKIVHYNSFEDYTLVDYIYCPPIKAEMVA